MRIKPYKAYIFIKEESLLRYKSSKNIYILTMKIPTMYQLKQIESPVRKAIDEFDPIRFKVREYFLQDLYSLLGEVTNTNRIDYYYAFCLWGNQEKDIRSLIKNNSFMSYARRQIKFIKGYVPERDNCDYLFGVKLSRYHPRFWPKEWNGVYKGE